MQLGRRYPLAILVATLLLALCADAQVQAILHIEKDAVKIRGKWHPSNAKSDEVPPHMPLVEINCFKFGSFCVHATDSARGDEPSLAVVYYQVTQWDKKGIVAENQDYSCTTNQLTIDFKDSTVTATDSPRKKGKGVAEACKALPNSISYRLVGEAAGQPMRADETTPAQ